MLDFVLKAANFALKAAKATIYALFAVKFLLIVLIIVKK